MKINQVRFNAGPIHYRATYGEDGSIEIERYEAGSTTPQHFASAKWTDGKLLVTEPLPERMPEVLERAFRDVDAA